MRTFTIILVLSLTAFTSAVAAKGDCCEYKIIDKGLISAMGIVHFSIRIPHLLPCSMPDEIAPDQVF